MSKPFTGVTLTTALPSMLRVTAALTGLIESEKSGAGRGVTVRVTILEVEAEKLRSPPYIATRE